MSRDVPVNTSTEPVIIRINRAKAVLLASLLIPIALLGAAFFIFAVTVVANFRGLTWAAFALAAISGAGAVFYFGLAARHPVALRMDVHGISGYYIAPVTWNEIAATGVFHDSKGNAFLGFALHDPIAFRERQTAWGRFKSWSMGRSAGFHLGVPAVVLKDANLTDLVQQADTLRAAHDTSK